MIDLVRSEWIKFRSVRSTPLVLLGGFALAILFAFIQAHTATDTSGNHLADITVAIPTAAFLWATLGIQVIGQEYRFNTIRTTFTAVPDRIRVLLAKLILVAAVSAATAVASIAACAAIGAALVSNLEVDATDRRAVLGVVLFSVGFSILGLGIGAILRQPVAAIVALLGWGFAVEPLLANLVRATRAWVPLQNGRVMSIRTADLVGMRSPLGGGIYFGVWVVGILVVGFVLANRRDA